MTPSTVTVSRSSWSTKDKASGRQPTMTADPSQIRCAVQPDSADLFPEHMREEACVYHTVKFYDDRRLKVRDTVNYQGRVLVVVGVRDTSGGVGRTWVCLCEERRPGG